MDGDDRRMEPLDASLINGEAQHNGWTDEKHSLYLDSIEASFVNELNNHHYHLMSIQGRPSRRQSALDPDSLESNGNGSFSSDQFRVIQRGHWQKLHFKRTQTQPKVVKGSDHLLENQFIQHFKPASSASNLQALPTKSRLDNERTGGMIYSEGLKYRRAAYSKQPHSCYSAVRLQDSTGSNTGGFLAEVSDQNFEQEESGKSMLFSSSKKELTVAVDVSSKDQVVPLVESPSMVGAEKGR